MRVKKQTIITLFLVSVGLEISAQTMQISKREAHDAAVARVATQTSSPRSSILVTNTAYYANEDGDTLLFEVATNKGLTVLLSGNKACLPILGVHGNEEGMLLSKYDSLPCGMKCLFDDYKTQIGNSFNDIDIESPHITEWQQLINNEQPRANRSFVLPLLKTVWTQRVPNVGNDTDAYNYLMPSGGNCNHCLAGCVAVAMGQVMYYWKYPVLVDSMETQFDWCNMSNTLNVYSPNYNKNRDAISFLLLKCGKSVNMEYGCDGSGAETADVRDALVEDFLYKNTASFKKRFWYSDSEWQDMLKDQLNHGRPVIYRGRTALINGKGHAFVCDGYNEYNEFHINWGWKGCSGPYSYYTLDHLCIREYDFQYHHAAIFYIMPDEEQDICDMTMHLDDFYIAHQQHDHPIYAATPKTMTTLVSASSTAPASWRTIPTGAMAEYVAHRDIILQPGFSAEAGCEFTARIEPCLLCDREMTLIENESVVEELGGTTDRVRMGNHTDSTTTTKSGIILFPNPTDNVINILTDKDIVMVSVFDMTGKNVTGWKKFTEQCGTFSISQMTKASLLVLAGRENVVAKKPTVSIDVSNLSIGTYTLLVKTINGDLQAARFIKK